MCVHLIKLDWMNDYEKRRLYVHSYFMENWKMILLFFIFGRKFGENKI